MACSISKVMTDSQAYVAFNLTENVGFATVGALVAECGSVVEAWERYAHKVARSGGEVDWEKEYEAAERYGVRIITLADEEYPKQLKGVPGCPLALYVKGSVAAISKPAIAMIGTRRATAYGKELAYNLSYDLAKAGWSIVSGLALGIDGESHRGALAAEGTTVGILGSGLDSFYPKENRELAREMVEKGGAVISEFPFGRQPDCETFPIRNHVVAALARGVVAVEAPVKSGTLITTSIAADLGRTVMAVPARVDNRMSAGCLKLIREGAILVRNADDILSEMSSLFPKSAVKPIERSEEKGEDDSERPAYSMEEALLMLHVDEGGISLEDLARKTKLPIAKVNALAMQLRIKGFIRFLPGNRISLLTKPR